MKYCKKNKCLLAVLIAIALGIALLTLTCNTASAFKDAEDKSPKEIMCETKLGVAAYAFDKRDELSTNEILNDIQHDWENYYKSSDLFSHSTYVDMQRMIRDITRKTKSGEWEISGTRENQLRYLQYEAKVCLYYGY